MNRSVSLPFLALVLAIAAAPGQTPVYRPAEGHVLSLRASDLRAMWQAFEGTAVGRLVASPEVKPVIDKLMANYREREAVILVLHDLAREAGAKLDLRERLMPHTTKIQDGDLRDLRAWMWVEDGEPTVVITLVAGQEESELLQKIWSEAMTDMADGETFDKATDGPELGGKKADLLRRRDDHDGAPPAIWYWNQEGRHVFGVGTPSLVGSLGDAAARSRGDTLLVGDRTGVVISLDLPALLAKIEEDDPSSADELDRNKQALAAFGVDGVQEISLAVAVDGDHIRESLFVGTRAVPKGLLGAWLDATAPLPAHPQVDDAMLQVGLALDLNRLEAVFTDLQKAMSRRAPPAAAEPDAFRALLPDLAKALTGGMSLQVSAPSRGSMIPRLSLALGIADRATLDELLARARSELEGITFDDRETDGVPWTSVKIPNSPSATVPTFAVLDDVLVLTESPATLRAMIRARAAGGRTAMTTDGAPAVAPTGEPRTALDVRYDARTIWSVMQDRYLPLAQLGFNQVLMMGGVPFEPLLEAGELPDAKTVAPHLGLGRGGLTVVDGGFVLSSASSLGDPFMASFIAIYTPLMPPVMGMGLDAARGQAQGRVAEARLERVSQAIATWRASFGGGTTLPRELGELFARGLLEGDKALVVPGDDNPGSLEYEDADGEIRRLKSSFRYVPEGKLKTTRHALEMHRPMDSSAFGDLVLPRWMPVDDDQPEEVAILLYEAREHPRRQRLVITADGVVHRLEERGAAEILGSK